MDDSLRKAEEILFSKFSKGLSVDGVPLLFILASPRSGSTLIYQLLINFFRFFYFSNFINNLFPEFPVIGAALDSLIDPRRSVSYKSAYGKTLGPREPSEASQVFRNWFGGEHPSQTKSCTVKPGKIEHLLLTMKSIYKLTELPILAKNAWNCFRIEALSKLFPVIHFLWVRRDIKASALSDLESRYRRGGSTVWNSATTANYKEIQKRPYWEQVVEQQYEYNRSIARDLDRFCKGQYLELWYEDVCDYPERELKRLDQYFSFHALRTKLRGRRILKLTRSGGPNDLEEDYNKIANYVERHHDRLKEYLYKG